jgi:thioredoxin-related protein
MKASYIVFGLLSFAALMLLGLARLESVTRLPDAVATPGWETDYVEALRKARESRKMILLQFTGSDWCSNCIWMEKEVLSTPQFKDYARENFVLLKIDFPQRTRQPEALRQQNDILAREYRLEVFPTFVILNSQGLRVTDFPFEPGDPDRFLRILKNVPKS